jgi:DNA-binding winged helix-turn-helix (wHTH) protein
VSAPVRYRFGDFELSPRRRLLLRAGVPVPLIPRYFDLLHLLVRRRTDAIGKQVIFTEVWTDVVVSDGALSQAVRTLRRTLGDDSREPRFIRTVSRHGYQFICADVLEEVDDDAAAPLSVPEPVREEPGDIHTLVGRLMTASAAGPDEEGEARDLAERLHSLNTAAAVAQLRSLPRHAAAVAVLRDTRWNVPDSGEVPLLTDPEAAQTTAALVRLRLASVARTVARRWAGAGLAGACAGAVAGVIGGVALYVSPDSPARPESLVALAAIGALAGGVGAAGIGAGLAAAEVLARSTRTLALALCGAFSGAAVSAIANLILRSILDGLVGLPVPIDAGALDGLVIGAAAGTAYGLATRQPPGGGLAAPTGTKRLRVVAAVAGCCAGAAVVLSLAGRPLIGGVVHEIARSSRDAQLVMEPLGYFIGEPGFGPITRLLLSSFEGGMFGGALAYGLTRRPRPLAS